MKKPLVCVIEDDGDLRLIVEHWLTGAGLRCAAAVDAAQAAARVSFAVEDTGPGIPPEHREAVFESFRQGEGLNMLC